MTPPRRAMSGSTAIATQPSAMYRGADSQRGAFGTIIFRPTPRTAPTQTTARTTVPTRPRSSRTQNGVYVPAMNTKIIEWSSRRITLYPRGDQTRRWYSALVPNSVHTVTL